MGTLTDEEKKGLRHFFLMQDDPTLVLQVAKSLTKNLTDVNTEEEALEVVFLHSLSIQTVLNKRILTKELLFKYLHQNKVPVGENLTKASLINRVVEYWKSLIFDNPNESTERANPNISSNTKNLVIQPVDESAFPIHQLARKFTEWFFKKYNEDSLKVEDFWSDARLDLRISASDGTTEESSQGNTETLASLQRTKQLFKFYFNPSITHESVQGRIDIHGLVLVLSCGTLHTPEACVGVFETVFGLTRDPFSDNNWKIKTVQLILKSTTLISSHRLEESESLRHYLSLPAPKDIGE